jgi:hypothetical protein
MLRDIDCAFDVGGSDSLELREDALSWELPLARPVEVTDRQVPLRTLRDAGSYLSASFHGVGADDALVATVEMLMTAAETGQAVEEATEQLEIFLLARRRVKAIARQKAGPIRVAEVLKRRLNEG